MLFSLFKPKSPISPEAQEWVAGAFQQLSGLYGDTFPKTVPVVLPTETFFPDPLGDGEESLRRLFGRVCGYMGVATEGVDLQLQHHDDEFEEGMKNLLPEWEQTRTGAAGLYQDHPGLERPLVTIKIERKNDLVALVATMAHELAHVKLLSHAEADRDAPDMEPLTDLMTVFCGLGLFTANSAFHFSQFGDGNSSGYRTRRLGYLPEETFGYALAYFARLRGEAKPDWAKFLNVNVGTFFRQAQRFLARQ